MSDSRKLIDDCFRTDSSDGGPIRHGEAIAMLRERLRGVARECRVGLDGLDGRVLSRSVISAASVPAFDNAAVDGFALGSLPDGAGRHTYRIVGIAKAGHPATTRVSPGEAIRILTGAVVPEGTVAIAMQEDATVDSDGVTVPAGLRKGANIRRAGEDVAAGATVFPAMHVVRPQDLAALASLGLGEAHCFERPRVGIVSTGDEVVPAGSRPLAHGEVYDANAAMIAALVETAGGEPTRLGILPDDRDAVRDALREAAGRFDVVITSGGASKGSEDHVAAVLAEIGQRHHWQIAIKPGRPMMFGQIGDTVIVGLPGNPVAVFVCFLLYVWPMVRVLGGGDWPEPRRFSIPAAFSVIGRKVGRREYWRAWLEDGPDGLVANKFPRDGSGLITGLRMSTGLIEVPEEYGDIAEGDLVSFIPLDQFGILSR